MVAYQKAREFRVQFDSWPEVVRFLTSRPPVVKRPGRRKGWKELSVPYRKRLIRAGITPRQYAAGKSLRAARGHAVEPLIPPGARNSRLVAYRNVEVMFIGWWRPLTYDGKEEAGVVPGRKGRAGEALVPRSMSLKDPLFLAWQQAVEFRQRGYVQKSLADLRRYEIRSWRKALR